MISIAIAEDELRSRERTKELLEKYAVEKEIEVKVVTFADGLDLAEEYLGQTGIRKDGIHPGSYQILFLDIQMKMMNGLEAAAKIREIDPDVRIIFITNYAKHAIDGYEVAASAFLVKPVAYPMLARIMDRMVKELERAEDYYLFLGNSRESRRINLRKVLYMESEEHYIRIWEEDKSFLFHCTMKEMEKKLEGRGFYRCDSGVIINLALVEAVEKNRVRVNGMWLPVSRSRRKGLIQAIEEYIM